MYYTFLTVYIILINFISVIVCIFDKFSAKHGGRRVSEKNLMLLSIAGGSISMYITMLLIRHKTRHNRFMIGLPLIISLQITALFLFLKKIS